MKYSFLILLISIASLLYLLKYEYIDKPILTEEIEIFILEDTTYDELVENLDTLFVNLNPVLKVFLNSFLEKKRLGYWFKPGRYLLYNSYSINDIVNKIRSQSQDPINITFNSMDDVESLFGVLSSQLKIDSIDFINYVKSNPISLDSLKLILIPNTYEVFWDISPEKFFQRMHLEYKAYWTPERISAAKTNNLSKNDVFILASIVDKEASHYDEMNIISGLYINRLKHNWNLSADPTIVYSMKKEYGKIIRRVRNKHINKTKKSPFNTYHNKGLPPFPICLPSLQAIESVLYPDNHNYMYMCAKADNSEYHHFSITHSEHLKYAKKFHKWLDSRKIY
tara:strand:- start:13564 stop:14577 length:1014 start_codon:yes stop_codon:yes gene_type:complete